jgi:signal transduction histidine kinase
MAQYATDTPASGPDPAAGAGGRVGPMSGLAGDPNAATPGVPPSQRSAASGLPVAPGPAPDAGRPAPTPAWPPAAASAPPALTRARLGSLARAFLRSPIEAASWRAFFAILLGFAVATVSIGLISALFSTGGSLLIWLVGIPIVALGIEASRLIARVERWRVAFVDRRPLVAHRYRPYDGLPRSPIGPWLRAWGETQFLDANRWRDVVYVLVLFPLAVLELTVVLFLWAASITLLAMPLVVAALSASGAFERLSTRVTASGVLVGDLSGLAFAGVVPAFLLGLLLIPVAASTGRGLMLLHRAVVAGLLCVDPMVALRQDVERLRGSRSAALELEASELRRIERDLHDGAQQRLVMLSIDLGLAEDRLASDPDSARQLVADAREQARLALGELRDLVRGTAPSILVDRGLVAALGAVAGNCPVPTTVDSGLADGERLPAAVERAAYFVVAESLANVAKHSGASHAAVTLRTAAGRGVATPVGGGAAPNGGGRGAGEPTPGSGSTEAGNAGAGTGARTTSGPWPPMWPGAGAGWRPTASGGSQAGSGWPAAVDPVPRLVVEVRDDGSGGAAVTAGGGLAGLRDRVEALDGSLVVSSPPGGPTVVRVEIPIEPR